MDLKLLISCLVFCLAWVGSTCASNEATHNRPGLTVRETFDLYVRAVQNTNLDALFSTVTESERFFFLTAHGKCIDTRAGYFDFHQKWFDEKDWKMPVELLESHEGNDYGYVTAIFHYRQKMAEGGSHHLDSYFTLIFHKEHGMWKAVADICTPIGRYTSETDPQIRYDEQQSYLFDIIKTRRTVRKFKSNPVPEEHIVKILDAARYAPTAGNQQPWKFLVIRDRHKLDLLCDAAVSWYFEIYLGDKEITEEKRQSTTEKLKDLLTDVLSAPVYVAILVDSLASYPQCIIEDGALAAGNLMIAARSLGYGTGYFTTFFPEEKMRKFFAIPEQYKLICFTPIGIPETWPETPNKKGLDQLVIYESFHHE